MTNVMAATPFEYTDDFIDLSSPGPKTEPNPHEDAVMALYRATVADLAEGKTKIPSRQFVLPHVDSNDAPLSEKDVSALVQRHIRFVRKPGDDHTTPFTVRTSTTVGAVPKTTGTGAKKVTTNVPATLVKFYVHTTKDSEGKTVVGRISRGRAAAK